jgi:hypothetical protein
MYIVVQPTGFCDYFLARGDTFDYLERYAVRFRTMKDAEVKVKELMKKDSLKGFTFNLDRRYKIRLARS